MTVPTTDVMPVALAEGLCEQELCPDSLLRGQEEAFARDIACLQARTAEFVAVPCPACAADESQFTFAKHTFRYVTCRHCGTLYMSPRPSPAVMASYYSSSENYRYWAKYIFPASEASRREKLHKPWLERVAGLCDRHGIPRGLLLEVGAGFGTFCAVAQQSGRFRRVVAVEPTPEMAEACRGRGIQVIPRGIEEITDEVPPADVAVAFEVVEHLFEPRRFFAQCARLLRPGGLLVVSCPNGQGFDVAVLGAASLAIDPEHVNLFNPRSLGLLARTCGFEVLEVSTPGRLDAEFVRTAALEGKHDLARDPFLRRVLLDEWETLGWPFQQFLAANGLSSHMWLAARRAAA
jgi:SAM-dependent methyltransferase